MTIASKGFLNTSLNTGNNQASTIHQTATTIVAPGNLAIIIMAVDNNATTDGDEDAVTSVSDGLGNTWSKAGEFCNSQGAAQAGSTVSVWYTRATVQIPTGTNITFNFSNNTSRDESCSTAWCFTCNGDISIPETPTTEGADAVDVGSLDVTTANAQRLRVRAIASELNDQTQMTATGGGWALFSVFRSANVATAQSVRGEWLISTGTGAASNPTLAVTTGDSASVYIAFAETLASGATTLNGEGNLSVDARIPQQHAEATFAGAGSLSVDPVQPAAAVFVQPVTNRPPPLRRLPKVELRPFGLTIEEAAEENIEATFSGTGSLSIDTTLLIPAQATLVGSGNLSANATLLEQAQAILAGVGNLSANATLLHQSRTTFTGAGSLSINATLLMQAQAIFAGTGNISVDATIPAVAHQGDTRFNGIGNFSANVTQEHVEGARFNGVGILSVDTIQSGTKQGEARFDGAGNLSADATLNGAAFARFGGAGDLLVDVTQTSGVTWGWHRIHEDAKPRQTLVYRARQSVAIVYPLAEVTVDWLQPPSKAPARHSIPPIDLRPFGVTVQPTAHQGAAIFNGAGSLTVTATIAGQANQWPGDARWDGAGNLSANVTLKEAAFATFSGAGSLSAQVIGRLAGYATFAGAGSLSINAQKGVFGAATFSGAGNLSVDVTANLAVQATFGGTGSLSVDAAKAINDIAATFTGTGNFSADATLKALIYATFNGVGTFSVDAVKAGTQNAEAIFNGAGSFRANVIQRHVEGARFASVGSLSIYARQRHVERARFEGAGSLSISATLREQARAIFGGLGTFSVDLQKLFAVGEARWNGSGLLTISTLLQAAGYASFNGEGNFSIRVNASYGASVRFTGTGNMLISVAGRDAAAEALDGIGNLSVQPSLQMAAQARFNGAGGMSINTFVLAFGSSLMEATFNGEGGMIINVTLTGPRHLHTQRPQYAGPVRRNTAYSGRSNLARGGRRNVA